MPVLSKLPLNYECWPEGDWDVRQFFYVHVMFSGPTAACGQEYYDFVGTNIDDADLCWGRGVVGGGTQCQLRYQTGRRCDYEAARSLVHRWPPAGRSLLCEMNVSCIPRLGEEGGDGDGARKGREEPAETGGWISVSWSACLSDSTRMQRYQLFLDIIPDEYAKDWRHDLARRDGGILSKFSTEDDDAYLGMSAAIDACMEETNYLFSEMKKLPSPSVASRCELDEDKEPGGDDEGEDDDEGLDRGGGRKRRKQVYLTKKKKGRKRDKRWEEEEEERKRHREWLKQDYEQRLRDDPEFAAREDKRKEEEKARDREKRRKKKEKKERAPMVAFMFGKLFGPEKWDDKMAEFQEKGLGRFMPVGDGKLATYVKGGGLEMVDREYLYRKEEEDEDHPDAREGKVPNCDEAPLYDEYDDWYNRLPIHRDFLAGDDSSRNVKDGVPGPEQRYYPFIELCPPAGAAQDEDNGEENAGREGEQGREGGDCGRSDDGYETNTSLSSDLFGFGECVDMFQQAYGDDEEGGDGDGATGEGGEESQSLHDSSDKDLGGGEKPAGEEEPASEDDASAAGGVEDEETEELPRRGRARARARARKRVIDSSSEEDD